MRRGGRGGRVRRMGRERGESEEEGGGGRGGGLLQSKVTYHHYNSIQQICVYELLLCFSTLTCQN